MCGRYYIDEETAIELQKIIINIDKKLNPLNFTGDIVPSSKAPVLVQNKEKMEMDLFNWGFKNFKNNGLIINARAETALEKRTFRDCLNERRCIVPAKGFYEWDKSRNKFTFQHMDKSVMFMAGIYNEENKFVILTTGANQSMEKVHDRMPLVLKNELIRPWLANRDETSHILKEIPPLLEAKAEVEQMRLEFF